MIRFFQFFFSFLERINLIKHFGTDVDGYSNRRRSSRAARLSLYDIHARTDQLPTPEAHIGTLGLDKCDNGALL